MKKQQLPKNPDVYELPEDIRQYAAQLYPNLGLTTATQPDMSFLENQEEEDILQKEIPNAPTELDLQTQNPQQDSLLDEQEKVPATSEIPTVAQKPTPNIPTAAATPGVNIADLIKKQEQDEDMLALWKAGSRMAAAAAGAGIGRKTEADLSMYEDMEKRAARPLKNFLLKQEAEQVQSKNDPNSEISKLARKSLIDLGLKKEAVGDVSFAQIEKLYPTLAQSLYTRISAQARVDQARVESEAKKLQIAQELKKSQMAMGLKQEELDWKKLDSELNRELEREKIDATLELKKQAQIKNQLDTAFRQGQTVANGIDRMVKEMRTSKSFDAYGSAKEARSIILSAIEAAKSSKKKSAKIPEATAFMRYAKIAQGDDSVVRNEDMKVLAGRFDVSDPWEMFEKLKARARGGEFTISELQAMLDVVKQTEAIKRKYIAQNYLDSIKLRAKKHDYNLAESLPYELVKELESEELSPMDQIRKKQKENEEALNKINAREAELLKKQG